MFASLQTWIRGLPLWARLIAWPFYGILRALAWGVAQLGGIIAGATGSTAHYVVQGSLTAKLVKIAAVLLLAGLLAVGFNLQQIGAPLILLSAAPIMVVGLIMMARSVLPGKKKKKAH